MTIETDLRQIAPAAQALDLSWLDAPTEWGVRGRPGKRGLTLDEVNVGSYGRVPEQSDSSDARPRGAAARAGVPRTGYRIRDAASVWSANATMLYEEAVQRQWSSATDIPWGQIAPLADDVERAMCQLCTFLTEVEFIAGDTPAQWLPKISNDHFETKLFLATQIMDEARHLDVFRKRALVNGGGLLRSSPSTNLRTIINARDFTEMSSIMHVQAEGFVQSMFRMGELVANNDVEKRMFRMCAQDESRHLGFGVMHLKYVLETEPERREEIHAYFDTAERTEPGHGTFGQTVAEALIILLGKGDMDEGSNRFLALQKRQANEYLHRLTVAGLGERRERMDPNLRRLLEPAA
ncbi:MAG: ferritin-like domain-containing protein [Dehalococcoidia bacterium]|nr:ferritin-like domain-containing protein [Dehalococcoidia bacterium]